MRRLFLSAVLAFAAVLPLHADDRVEHGDWVSQFNEDRGEASTHDNGAAMFGMLCADRLCRYYYANGIECEPGSNYPMMLATAAGAVAIDGICEPMKTANGDVMLFWIAESPKLNEALSQSESIGIAFPLANGQFRTNLFSMNGYDEAIARMVEGLKERMEQESPSEAVPEDEEPAPDDGSRT